MKRNVHCFAGRYFVIVLIVLLLVGSSQLYAGYQTDSITALLEVYHDQGKVDNEMIELLKQLYNIEKNDQPYQALEYAAEALQIAQSLEDTLQLAVLHIYIGDVHFAQNVNYLAMDHYFRAYEMYNLKNDKEAIASCLINIGNVYYAQENFDLALTYFNRAFDLFSEMKNEKGIALALTKTGWIALKQEKYNKAFESFSHALNFRKQFDDKCLIASTNEDLAAVCLQNQEYNNALNYLNHAMDIYIELDEKREIAEIHYLQGNVFSERNLYPRALDNYFKALEYSKLYDDNPKIAEIQVHIGRIYLKDNKPDEAIVAAISAMEKASEIGLLEQKKNASLLISNIYSYQEMPDSALYYFRKYDEAKNLILSEKELKQSDLLHVTLETQRKENEIVLLRIDKEKQLVYVKFLIVIIILILSFILFILYRYREKIRYNKQLQDKNCQIQEREEELMQTLEKLNERTKELLLANNGKDKMFSIISHDLRNPIGTFKGMLQVLAEDPGSFDDASMLEMLQSLSETANMTYNLLENLLYWARSQRGKMLYEPEVIALKQLVDENVALLSGGANNKSLKLLSTVDEEITIYGDENMVNTIIRNLVSNAIKFTPQNGEIRITAVH